VSSETIEDHRREVPNQGIRRSALNGVRLGLISALFVGLSYALSVGLSYVLRIGLESSLRYEDLGSGLRALNYGLNFALGDGLNSELSAGLQAGVFFGLLVCLYHGGLAYLRHYVLRLLLRLSGSIPWDYVHFLNQAARYILLHRTGSGYSFIHRLFLDYIADHSSHFQMSEGKQMTTNEDSVKTRGG